ncbi:helix-turn-helix transcriptional regulator [Arthrobacter sp. NPDC058192]|uniref:helix-turn-helix transcriptional regulator n=1 Tax=Arthrobacter sp. NPDC058192 TaxID=3346372 RepID=UPI0036F024C0
MAVALESMAGTPFQQAAHTALRKLVAAMQASDAAAARELAARVHLLGPPADLPPIPSVIADALSAGRVLRISYQDRDGAMTSRELEPLGYVGKPTNWYLVGWCRLRDGIRVFRTDRITSSVVTAETPAPRVLRAEDLAIPYGDVRQLTVL